MLSFVSYGVLEIPDEVTYEVDDNLELGRLVGI